jgi:hypothetical protein
MSAPGFDLFSLYSGQLNFGQTLWEHLGERIWELDGNLTRTREKHKKIPCSLLPPAPPPKGKNRVHHECMLSLPTGCTEFLFPKRFVTIFWPGLVEGAKIWGHSYEYSLVHLYMQQLLSAGNGPINNCAILLKNIKVPVP